MPFQEYKEKKQLGKLEPNISLTNPRNELKIRKIAKNDPSFSIKKTIPFLSCVKSWLRLAV